jgi:hypothetical protein
MCMCVRVCVCLQESGDMISLLDNRRAVSTQLGALSVEEKRFLEAHLDEIVADDYFVACEVLQPHQQQQQQQHNPEREKKEEEEEEQQQQQQQQRPPQHTAGAAGARRRTITRLHFQRREPLETDKEVVLINCRRSGGGQYVCVPHAEHSQYLLHVWVCVVPACVVCVVSSACVFVSVVCVQWQ